MIDKPSAAKTKPVVTIDRGIAVNVMNVVRKFNKPVFFKQKTQQ